MADVEFAEVVYGKGRRSFLRCPCRVPEPRFYLSDHRGRTAMQLDGPCLKCFACGRVLSADGVVLMKGAPR